ncbi:MAG: FAD-dependent oxidoreductase [Oscillospiraceae bacterium]|nr:FAD-dependent oxidoreductase [Oscillospiraceae bacterium]
MAERAKWASGKWGSWADIPEAIPEEKISERVSGEVVIVGAGVSGMAAALRAAQLGQDVIVLERGKTWSGRGGNFGVPESSFLRSQGIEIDKEAFVREWVKRCGSRCDEKIVWLYVNNSLEAMDWLFDIMTKDGRTRPIVQGAIYRGETYRELPGSHRFMDGPMAKKGMRPGGADVVNALYELAVEAGVRFYFSTRGEQLFKENGRVAGVIASREDGSYIKFSAEKGVVLATGDISGNPEMLEDLCPDAEKCIKKIYFPVGQNTGDGHRMGLWAGGMFDNVPFPLMVHPQYPALRNYCFLFVNHRGERFMNEDNYVQGKCNAIFRQNRPFAWSIIDSAWAEKVPLTLPYGGGIFWDQDRDIKDAWSAEEDRGALERSEKAGALLKADTIEELAEKMGVPAENLKKTFERYNELSRAGKDLDFGKRRELLIPLDTPPYMALKFGAALLTTVGGLKTDERLRVVDGDLDPIPGLYAVGNAGGGRYGMDYPLVVPGSSHGTALVFGYLAAEFIAGRK